ncbi:hypothetical protein ABK040_012133 [Willaertia magna]
MVNENLPIHSTENNKYQQKEGKETLPGGSFSGRRETIEEIENDPNYELEKAHLSGVGVDDYTLVFRHKYGGYAQTFPNVSKLTLNDKLRKKLDELEDPTWEPGKSNLI